MENKRIIDEKMSFPIPVTTSTYKVDIFWKDILATKGILETDKLVDIHWVTERESGMFSMRMEDELEDYQIPYITISRKRQETDEEFVDRLKKQEKINKATEEQEKLQYLRLKAKFES